MRRIGNLQLYGGSTHFRVEEEGTGEVAILEEGPYSRGERDRYRGGVVSGAEGAG